MPESVLTRPVRQPQIEPKRSQEQKTQIVVHWRWLFGLIAISVVLGLVFYWRYNSQAGELAKAMLDRADQLEKEGSWVAAAEYLFQYLQFRPREQDIWVRLANTYEKGAATRNQKDRAIQFYYRALGVVSDPAKKDALNLQLAELLLNTGQFSESKIQASLLGDHPGALRIVGLALAAESINGDPTSQQAAFEALQKAIEKNPADVEVASTAAYLCRTRLTSPTQSEREAIANSIMQKMIAHEANKSNAKAWLASYVYRKTFRVGNYDDDLVMATRLGPDDFAVALAAGQKALEQVPRQEFGENQDDPQRHESLAEAEKWFRNAIRLEPTKSAGYHGLGTVLLLQRKPGEAAAGYREGLTKTNDDPLGLHDRLANSLLADKKLTEAQKAIDDYRQATDRYVQRSSIVLTRRDVVLQRARVDYLQAKLHLAREETIEAIRQLDGVVSTWQTVVPDAEPFPDRLEAFVLLSGAYGRAGQWDQAAMLAERAAKLSPQSPKLALSAAAAWKAAGNSEKAAEYYDRANSLDPQSITNPMWIDIAEARLALELSRPAADRDWEPFRQALRKVVDEGVASWRARMLLANYAFATKGADAQNETLKQLALAEKAAPNDSTLWQRLVYAYHYLGREKDADRALEQFKANQKNPFAYDMLRLTLMSLRGQQAEAVRQGEELLRKAPPDQREAVTWELVQLNRRAGNADAVRQGLLELHRANPDRTNYLIQLAEIDLRRRDAKSLETWDKELERLQGESGVHWRYYRAYRLLFGIQNTKEPAALVNDPAFQQATQLYAEIDLRRPSWAPAYALQGLLVLLEGKETKAIESYQRAVELGYNDILTLRALVMLLYRAQRFAEADSYLDRWRRLAPSSKALDALSISLAAEMDQLPEAVQRAREAVKQRPADAQAKVWLSQMLEANNNHAEAEEVLKRATGEHAKDAQVWAALFSYYLRRNQRSAAESALNSLASKAEAEKSERAFMVAQGYELLGDTEKAEKLYRRAAELGSTKVQAQVRLAAMLVRRDPAEAEKLLRESLATDPNSSPARRLLAAILAGRGGAEAWQEVQQLLANEESDAADARLKSLLLSLRGGAENLQRAIDLLRPLVKESPRPLAMDRMLLASLYDRQGKTQAAEEQHQELITETESQPALVVNYVAFLLRHERPADAEKQLASIEASVKSGTLQDQAQYAVLKARCLKMQQRMNDLRVFLQQFIAGLKIQDLKTADEKADVYSMVARMYEALELFDPAIEWRRKLVAIRPQTYPYLARDLNMAGKYREAIDQFRQAGDEDKTRPEFASLVVSVLVTGNTPPEIISELEPLIASSVSGNPDNADALYAMATIRAIQGQNDEAVSLLERANRLRPNSVPILNNLATLLGELPGRQEDAIYHIDNAIGIVGQQPALLDTKATILTRIGGERLLEAIELLEQTVTMPYPDPRFLLHLAFAYQQNGEESKAESMFHKAIEVKVQSQILTQADKELLRQLQQLYGNSVASSSS
jgi:tetratricopeptide (TPR) repeat protein